MRTAADIGRVWRVVHQQAGARVDVRERTYSRGFAGQPVMVWPVFPGDPPEIRLWGARVWSSRESCAWAFGLTEEEALAALGELVELYARMRVEEIETALRGGA